jgi:hypothetical protein
MNYDTVTINYKLYYEIWKARKASALKTANEILPMGDMMNSEEGRYDCKLVGRKIKNIETGEIYSIEKVYIRYYFGWHVDVLYVSDKGSHGFIHWMSITDYSNDKFVSEECDRNREIFKLVRGKDISKEDVIKYINKYCPQKVVV